MLSKYSKAMNFDGKTGVMKWQRSAIGGIEKVFVTETQRKEPNVALVIKSFDVKKTRISEY
jgi:hypothetical protein